MPIGRLLLTLLTAALAVTSLSCGRREPAEWTVTVQRVASPAGANTSEPQMSVSERGILLSWIERLATTTSLKFTERTASGWTAPITAVSGVDWFLSYADVPSVQRLADGTLVAQWLQTTDPVIEAYDLRLAYSKDNGKAWAPSFVPHHDGTRSQHGFASLVEMAGGQLGIVWLDGRNSTFDPDDPESGTMMLRFAAFDANWKQTADIEIDHRVCECCSTTAVVTSDGVLAGFRDRDDQEVRDMGVSRLEGGRWTPTTLVSQDNWRIDFCPVNGPMLSARGREVAAAWFTVRNDLGQAYAAFSNDAGRSWSAPIRLDEAGSLGRVDIELLDDGSAVATWVEYAEGRSEFRLRRVDRSGARSAPLTVAGVSAGRASGFPRVARQGDELVFAWSASAAPEGSEDGALQVYTAVASLP
ncbi:MAG: exo-alpha-sialidase [Acidobacteria bacterium]|nr:exo-alpha-sialidase [Acidobacteriota bacterium]